MLRSGSLSRGAHKVREEGHLGLGRGRGGRVGGPVVVNVEAEVLRFMAPYVGEQVGACAFYGGQL